MWASKNPRTSPAGLPVGAVGGPEVLVSTSGQVAHLVPSGSGTWWKRKPSPVPSTRVSAPSSTASALPWLGSDRV